MNPLERLWKDSMDIYRYEEQTVNNITKNVKSLKQTGVKCKYSKGSLSDTGENGVPSLVNSYSIFCGLNTDIQEGDEIIITQKTGKQITLTAGEGFPYSNHQEFSVKRSEKA